MAATAVGGFYAAGGSEFLEALSKLCNITIRRLLGRHWLIFHLRPGLGADPLVEAGGGSWSRQFGGRAWTS